jgi:hypothetical protein
MNAKLAGLIPVAAADFRPPRQGYQVFDTYVERLGEQLRALDAETDDDVSEFENLVHEMEVPAIVPRTTP